MNIRILRRRKLGFGSTKGIKQYSKHNIEIVRNDTQIPDNTDLLIRWGCTSHMNSKHVLNKSQAIQRVNNKVHARKALQDAGVSVPKLFNDIENVQFPVIVRPHYHSQGKKLWLCENLAALTAILYNLNGDYYISEYIPKDKEYGVFVFNNRVWAMIEKVPKTENANLNIAWNVAQGTHAFENIKWSNWNIDVCKEALRAANVLEIDFCRVDVIVKDNKPYVLELNSAHSLTSEYRKKTFAKCLDYYIEHGKVKNELELDKCKTFKSIIHPALRMNQQGTNL